MAGVAGELYVQPFEELAAGVDEDCRLPADRRDREDGAAWEEYSLVDGLGGGDGGLAPLARAVEDAALDGRFEDFDLLGIGDQVEAVLGELDGAEKMQQVPEDRPGSLATAYRLRATVGKGRAALSGRDEGEVALPAGPDCTRGRQELFSRLGRRPFPAGHTPGAAVR